MDEGAERDRSGGPAPLAAVFGSGRAPLLLFAAYALLAVPLYSAALTGPFLSDDIAYLVTHPYTAPLSWRNLWEIWNPWGPAKLYAANYAPMHLTLTALERQIFADWMPGYHLVNVLVHAGNAALLAAWLRRAAIAPLAAALAGLFFLVHPANVEAVAWVSQLKTDASLAFALGALLLLRRAPAAAAGLFALSLLTKASGLFALPTAVVWLWADRGAGRRDVAWLLVWTGIAALYAVPQFASFAHLGQVEVAAYQDPWVHLRSIFAVAARYLVMAPTAMGVSAWQEPEPAHSWLDPWWLISLPLLAVLAARLLWTLARRRVEAAFWTAAAASFAPVSQIFPFPTPVADRYLYFILPGLLGGALLWARAWLERAASGAPAQRARIARLAGVAGLAVVAAFCWQSAARAGLWQGETLLLLDAARHYPDGTTALVLRARAAAQQGDVEAAVAALRGALSRGLDRFNALEQDPGLAPIRDTPQFRALMSEMAGRWIALAHARGYETQPELRFLAIAHLTRQEYDEAIAALEAALAVGGPLTDVVRSELEQARVARIGARARRERDPARGERGGEAPQ